MAPFPLDRPARLAVFASGRGSNLEALVAAFPPSADAPGDAAPLGRMVLAISDVADAPALERARAAGIEALALPWRPPDARARFERAALAALDERAIDLVCLAGFMRILTPAFVARWAGRLLNVHPSLLPNFPGLEAQRQAIAAGARRSGCTVHFVDEGIDTGPTVVQRSVPVLSGDDPETLAERIAREEHRAYPDAVRRVLRGEAVYAPEGETRKAREARP